MKLCPQFITNLAIVFIVGETNKFDKGYDQV